MKIDKTFDAKILKIPGFNPNWLPWIGLDYNSPVNKKKILIVGESHYLTEDVDVTQKDYTRELIEKDGTLEGVLYESDPNKFISERHKKLEKILSIDQNDIVKKREFWSNAAYYNFIQTPLDSRDQKDRPPFSLYLTGWDVFFQIIKIIKPRFCILNGIESINHFNPSNAEKFGYSTIEKIKLEKIGEVYPRKIILEEKNSGDRIKILFIKHSSLPMTVSDWQSFILSELK